MHMQQIKEFSVDMELEVWCSFTLFHFQLGSLLGRLWSLESPFFVLAILPSFISHVAA